MLPKQVKSSQPLFFVGKPEKHCSLSAAAERILIRIIQRIQKVRKFTDISCL